GPRPFSQPRSQLLQTLLIAGDEDQIVAAAGQAVGIGCADTRRCARDQCSAGVIVLAHRCAPQHALPDWGATLGSCQGSFPALTATLSPDGLCEAQGDTRVSAS